MYLLYMEVLLGTNYSKILGLKANHSGETYYDEDGRQYDFDYVFESDSINSYIVRRFKK